MMSDAADAIKFYK